MLNKQAMETKRIDLIHMWTLRMLVSQNSKRVETEETMGEGRMESLVNDY